MNILLWILLHLGLAVAMYLVAWNLLQTPIDSVLRRIIADTVSRSWLKFMQFVLFTSALSGSFKHGRLQSKSLIPENFAGWLLDGVSAIVKSLTAMTWLLLFFFMISMVLYVILRIWGPRRSSNSRPPNRNNPRRKPPAST